jgi:hypothetical protein
MLNWDLPNLPPASVLLRDPFFDEVRADPLLRKIEYDAFRVEVRLVDASSSPISAVTTATAVLFMFRDVQHISQYRLSFEMSSIL